MKEVVKCYYGLSVLEGKQWMASLGSTLLTSPRG